VTLDTLEEAMEQLATLPDTPESRSLRDQADVLKREMLAWSTDAPPSAEEREAMMKRVLVVYTEVDRLARGAG
jgi:hypothetical protein